MLAWRCVDCVMNLISRVKERWRSGPGVYAPLCPFNESPGGQTWRDKHHRVTCSSSSSCCFTSWSDLRCRLIPRAASSLSYQADNEWTPSLFSVLSPGIRSSTCRITIASRWRSPWLGAFSVTSRPRRPMWACSRDAAHRGAAFAFCSHPASLSCRLIPAAVSPSASPSVLRDRDALLAEQNCFFLVNSRMSRNFYSHRWWENNKNQKVVHKTVLPCEKTLSDYFHWNHRFCLSFLFFLVGFYRYSSYHCCSILQMFQSTLLRNITTESRPLVLWAKSDQTDLVAWSLEAAGYQQHNPISRPPKSWGSTYQKQINSPN